MLTFWEKSNGTFIIEYVRKEYYFTFILQKIIDRMTQWVSEIRIAL